MIERHDAARRRRPARAPEKLTTSGPIGIEAPFISVTKSREEIGSGCATMASLVISRTGLPAVGRVDPAPARRRAGRSSSADVAAGCAAARAERPPGHSAKPRSAAATAAATSACVGDGDASQRSEPVLEIQRVLGKAPDNRLDAMALAAVHATLVGGAAERTAPATAAVVIVIGASCAYRTAVGSLNRPISALTPIARTNNTISSAYMRGMSNVAYGLDDEVADAAVRQLGLRRAACR